MPARSTVLGLATAVAFAACGSGTSTPTVGGGGSPAEPAEPAEPDAADVSPSATRDDGLLPSCADIPEIEPAAELFRDSPIYVGNEQPTEAVVAWASTHDGYEELWLDRDHNGWIVVAFSQDVEARRAEAAALFPDDGVAVIEVDWSVAALRELQDTVPSRLGDVGSAGYSVNIMKGVLELDLGVSDDDTLQRLSEEFRDEPVCIQLPDPATVAAPGPQPTEGEGWRLLAADPDAGVPYMTGVATTADQLRDVWRRLDLEGDPSAVDFASEVVVWFGVAYGSSCPEQRLDDVVVTTDGAGAVVFPVVVDPTNPVVCTSDLAGGTGFVTAVERSRLPVGPFVVQLQQDGALSGDPAERTRVDVDLSVPGATADDGDVVGIGRDPQDQSLRDGGVVEPGFPAEYVLYVHCGVARLGTLNGIFWVSSGRASPSDVQPTPPAWMPFVDEREEVVVEVLLEEGDPPTVTATLDGTSVTYVPGDPDDLGCD